MPVLLFFASSIMIFVIIILLLFVFVLIIFILLLIFFPQFFSFIDITHFVFIFVSLELFNLQCLYKFCRVCFQFPDQVRTQNLIQSIDQVRLDNLSQQLYVILYHLNCHMHQRKIAFTYHSQHFSLELIIAFQGVLEQTNLFSVQHQAIDYYYLINHVLLDQCLGLITKLQSFKIDCKLLLNLVENHKFVFFNSHHNYEIQASLLFRDLFCFLLRYTWQSVLRSFLLYYLFLPLEVAKQSQENSLELHSIRLSNLTWTKYLIQLHQS